MINGKPTTVRFMWAKETPGTHQYQEVDASGHTIRGAEGAIIGALYVRKSALRGAAPTKLEVTVRTAD